MNAVEGFEDSTFRPEEQVTRAQIVKIAAATLKLYPWVSEPNQYADIAPDAWYAGWVSVGHRAQLIGPAASFPVWMDPSFAASTPGTRAEAAMLLANLPMTPLEAELAISTRAADAISALQAGDMAALGALVHPTQGIRFSRYDYAATGPGGDLIFPGFWLTGAVTDATMYWWGHYDGTGDPIYQIGRASCRERV